MTVKELKEKLQDVPDDFIVTCTIDESSSTDGKVYEAGDELRILHSDDTIF